YNGHGDVVQIVDTAGTVKNSYDYDVWGNFLKKEETIENHFTYFGQTYDETTGLYYLRARYYDPTTGRFTQQDTSEDGYNWYVYGNQNPVLHIDPSGENWIYNAWNWSEDAIWKGIALGVSAYGWQLTADLLWLAASGSGNTFTAGEDSYSSNLLKNDVGINKFINDVIWVYGTAAGNKNPIIPTQSYEIPLSNGDLGAALHNVYIDIIASQDSSGVWNATITITDTFDFTEFKNPFSQDSVLKGLLWAVNDVAYMDTIWGLLDPVGVSIIYKKQY
ncbi:MAG: RHS repeat-associated core domain-containing protein, partial [Clostridia bacterium]|nr:RHS repeat-associated core domain-containing protein [Clostridia bacterium]